MKKYLILSVMILFNFWAHAMNEPERDFIIREIESDEACISKKANIQKSIYDLFEKKTDLRNQEWLTLLYQCTYHSYCADLLELMLEKGINPNFEYPTGDDYPLVYACYQWKPSLKNLSMLLLYGANPNVRTWSKKTPLMLAVRHSCLETVNFLLENGANPNLYDKLGNTVLMHAVYRTIFNECRCKNLELREKIVEALLKAGADINSKNEKGLTAYDIAASKRGFNDLAYMIDPGEYIEISKYKSDPMVIGYGDNCALLMQAVAERKISLLKDFVINTNNINARDKFGYTALMRAVLNAHSEYDERLKILLNHGANVNIRSFTGYTALSIAVSKKNEKIVELLLEYGSNINISDFEGKTALSIACDKGFKEIAKILFEHGCVLLSKKIYDCDLDAVLKLIQYWGYRHLYQALSLCKCTKKKSKKYKIYLSIIDALLNKIKFSKSVIIAKTIKYRLLDVMSLLLKYLDYKDINFARNLSEKEEQRLSGLVNAQSREIAKFKFRNCKSYNSNDFDNIRKIVCDYQKSIQKLRLIKQMINLLIFVSKKKIAIPYCIDQSLDHFKKLVAYRDIKINNRVIIAGKAMTPLMIAVEKNKFDIIKFLLANGANVDYQCKKSGETALMIAVKKGYYSLVKILLVNGANPDLIDHQEKNAMSYALQKNDQNMVDLLLWSQI